VVNLLLAFGHQGILDMDAIVVACFAAPLIMVSIQWDELQPVPELYLRALRIGGDATAIIPRTATRSARG
jgi:hypothetical protein